MTSPVRVLHVDHSTVFGGAELALFRMLRLPPDWHATLFVPNDPNEKLGVYASLAGGPVTVEMRGPAQATGASRGGIVAMLRFAERALRQSLAIRFSRAFSTAHVIHGNTSRSAVYAAVACLGSRKKLVVHLRDVINVETLGGVGFRLFTRVALRRADGVIANSQASLDSALPYIKDGVPRQVIASASGLNPMATERRSELPGPVTVGMVARIDPWKGQDLLLRAFARSSRPDDRLVFAGSAPFGNDDYVVELREMASSLGISDRVDFLGHVHDVPSLLSEIDICVQSSVRPEPLGQNVLQYLAAGRPTIATNAGGPAEWITDGVNGLLFELANEDSLVDALDRLSSDIDLRSRLASAAPETPGLVTDAEIARLHGDFFAKVSQSTVEAR